MGVRQTLRQKAGEHAKSEVQQPQIASREGPAEAMARVAELRNDPKATGLDGGGEPENKAVQLRLREAIEQEVSGNQIGCGRNYGGEDGRVLHMEAVGVAIPCAAALQ